MGNAEPSGANGIGEGLSQTLRKAGVWVWHNEYAKPEPEGCRRSRAPFEAADLLDMQAREIAALKELASRSLAQLNNWTRWHSNAEHAAGKDLPMPPAGCLELAEDISAALGGKDLKSSTLPA